MPDAKGSAQAPERPGSSGNGAADPAPATALTKKEFTSDQEVRWCPGCGDYAILSAVQGLMPELGIAPKDTVFVSGIGCSGRFTYYMDTYGMHGIHGRAPALATGIAVANPELSVWVVTGDGDGLSIGGNHLIHALRRNVNFTILLFNNQIYGLTKGQYSPTSELGKVTKSSPFGSLDHPFNPLALALGAEATFVARTHDMDRDHMMEMFRRGYQAQAIVSVLLDSKNKISLHIYDQDNPPRYAQRQVEKARKKIDFQTDAEGKPFKGPGNIRIALLKLGITLRYDRFADRTLIEGLPDFGPALDDAAVNRIWLLMEQRFKFRPAKMKPGWRKS